MLDPHPSAALEYWFFKVNAGPVALIVDWIVRRRAREFVVRASYHAPGQRFVRFEQRPWPPDPDAAGLTLQRTAGQVGDLRWDLALDPGPVRISPDVFPARLLGLPDLVLSSAPRATFTGQIAHGDRVTAVAAAPGLVTHYWGRQLAREWWWVAASQFDQPGVAVEASVIRTALWGVPVGLPLAYLSLHADGRDTLLVGPPALFRASGTPPQFELRFQGLGVPITLKATGRDYGDFGEGITNTLVGDLDVYQGDRLLARARGTAGLERRTPQRAAA